MAVCCPKTFTGFCLDDQTPIAITIDNGVLISWIDLITGVVTPGPPPAGTGVCEVPSVVTVDIEPLTCDVDSVTVCQGTDPWIISGTVSVVEPVTVDGTVELGATTLAALEIITVNQGTSPWVVSGTVSVTEPVTVDAIDFDIRNLDCVTDSVTICPGLDPIVVNQGTTPWIVSGAVTTLTTYAEDSGHVSGDIGDFILAVRNDAGTTLVNADLDYAPLQVDSTGALRTSTAPIVIAQSVVSAPNSTATPLAGGATFTGPFVDCLEFADVTVTLATSHNSATDGLILEWSTDGVNVDADDVFTILGSAGPGKQFTFGVSTKFVRVRYVNGGTPQTFFRLQTILKRIRGKPSSHRVGETITLEDDAELVKAVIAGQTTAGGGSTVNVKVNPSGTLEVNSSQGTSPWVVSGEITTTEKSLVPKGYQQIVPVVSTALTVPGGAIYALLQARTADISYRDDGVAPTNLVGMRIVHDNSLFYTGNLAAVRVISAGGTLDILYYGVV